MYPSILVTLIVFTYIGGLSLEQETVQLSPSYVALCNQFIGNDLPITNLNFPPFLS